MCTVPVGGGEQDLYVKNRLVQEKLYSTGVLYTVQGQGGEPAVIVWAPAPSGETA